MKKHTPKEQASASDSSAKITAVILFIAVVAVVCLLWQKIHALPWYWQIAVGWLLLVILVRIYLLTTRKGLEESLVATAQVMFKAGKCGDALKRLDIILKAHPTNSEAWYLRGQCLDRLGRNKEAHVAWAEALKQNPSHAGAAHDLACDHMNRRDFLTAAKYMSMARKSWAELVEPSVFQGNIKKLREALTHSGLELERNNDFEKALEYANAIVSMDPGFAIGLAWRAKQHVNVGHYREAIEDAKLCLRLDPSYTKVNLVLQAAEEELNRESARIPLGLEKTSTQHKETIGVPLPDNSSPSGLETLPGSTPKSEHVEEQSAQERSPGIILWKVGEKAFGRISIRKIIGEGGMGTVYCGWDEQSETPLALKAIRLEGDEGHELWQKVSRDFQQEAEQWFRLGKHPRIVKLVSVEKLDYRHLVLVMEFISGDPEIGPTLRHHLRAKKQLPPEAAVRIAIQIAEAMQYACEKGQLVHRDLKPQNVFVTTSGRIKVGDFGLAVREGSIMGGFAGTLEYAAPEQFSPEAAVKPTMDVYAVGIMLFEMICGGRPFELEEEYRYAMPGARVALFREKHQTGQPSDPVSFGVHISRALHKLILRCLVKDESKRPTSFAELKKLLLPFAGAQRGSDDSGVPSGFDESVVAAYDNGRSFSALGHLEEALNWYRAAVRNEPFKSRRSEAWTNMSKVLGELHRFEESIVAARRALEIDPKDLNALHCLSMSLAARGELDEAEQSIDRLLAIDSGRSDAYVCKGWIFLFGRQDVDRAAEAYGKALLLKPDHQVALNGLGLCAEARRDYATALQFFDQAIELHPDFSEARNNRSRVMHLLGRDEQASRLSLPAVDSTSPKRSVTNTLGFERGKVSPSPVASNIAKTLCSCEAIDVDSQLCIRCGRPLISSEPKVCPMCNALITGTTFCTQCGAKIEGS